MLCLTQKKLLYQMYYLSIFERVSITLNKNTSQQILLRMWCVLEIIYSEKSFDHCKLQKLSVLYHSEKDFNT